MMILVLAASEIKRDVLELSMQWKNNLENPMTKEVQAFIDELQANTDCCHSTTKTFTKNPLNDEVIPHTAQGDEAFSSSDDAQKKYGETQEQNHITIFMSYSIPKEVWQGLWRESIALKQPIQFVLRGLPNNSFQELAKKSMEYGCPVSIDPPLFERYNITAVPAFLIQREVVHNAQQNSDKPDHNQNHGQRLNPRQETIFLGNVSLACVVEKKKQKNTTPTEIAMTQRTTQKETRS